MCPLAHARTRYTCVHTQTHMCVRAAEVPAEVQRGPRAPLSKKELTSSPHDEKILHPGGEGGLAQKDHHDVTNVHVSVCACERGDVGWRIERKRKDEGASSFLDNDLLLVLSFSVFLLFGHFGPFFPHRLLSHLCLRIIY